MAKSKYKKAVKNPESQSDLFVGKNLFRIIIFCFSFLLYVNTIPNDYNLDDELVSRNHKLTSKGIDAIPEIFASHYYSDKMGYAYEYRPIVHVSFALEHQLFGENAHVSHFVNALLYSCMCLLLFVLLMLLFQRESGLVSFLITLLFAAHPVHTEVVASIKNRDEILALFFALASWYIILKYSQNRLVLSAVSGCIFFLAGLLSKISIFGFVIIIPFSLLFFQRLPLYKTLIILSSLFIPSFCVINIISTQFKLLLFVALAAVLYLGYFLNLWLYSFRRENKNPLLVLSDWKGFWKQEIFPFNHRFFSRALYLTLLLLSAINCFIFIKSGNYYGVIVFSGLCLLFSLRAQGIYKWLLLVAFQLSLSLIQYLVSEQFAFITFLSWFFFALLFAKSETREEKLIFGSLLVICIPLSFMSPYPYRSYLFIVFISLLPIFYHPAKKIGKYIFIFIVSVLLLDFFVDLFRGSNYPVSLAPVTILYFWVAYYPPKVRLRKSWLFILLFILHFFFSFTAQINYNRFNQIEELRFYFSGKDNQLSETSLPSENQQPSVQTKNHSKDQVLKLPSNFLPESISDNVHRPLDFVENPVRFNDPLSVRIASAFDVMLRYLKLLVIPYPMSYYYGYKVIKPVQLSDLIVISSILLHFLFFLLAIFCLWQGKLIPFFGIVIYFISILQFTNIFQAVPGMMADRYLLVPSLGFCIVTAYLLIRLLKLEKLSALPQMTKTSRFVIISLLLLYSGLTIARNKNWKNNLTLFRHDIQHLDQSAQAHNLLGLHLMAGASGLNIDKIQQKQFREEALTHFKKALEIYPKFFNVAYDLGRTYLQLEVPDSALVYFQLAQQLNPAFSETHLLIGEIFFYQARYKEAITHFQQAVKLRPDLYKGYDKLSYVYYTIEEFDKALEVNRVANRKMPALKDPLINIGRIFLAMNQTDSARIYFEKALLFDPGNLVIRQLLLQTENR